jgi:hypothetical protein
MPGSVLALQQSSFGNQAMLRMTEARRRKGTPAPDSVPVNAGTSARKKCTCSESDEKHKCEACAADSAVREKAIPSDKLEDLPSEPVAPEQVPVEEAASEAPAEGSPGPAPEEDKGKTELPEVKFEVVHESGPPPSMANGKNKCTPPGVAATAFPVVGSTAAQIAAMGACTWGITEPDPLVVTTNTCEDGGDWHLRVMGVVSRIRTFSRQLTGQQEPTTANSTAGNFCDQVGDLDALGRCAGNWYMLSAVKAHENVHVNEWKTSFPTDWPAQKAIIDGITVPAAGATTTGAAATTAMRGSANFTNAVQTDRASGNFPTFWGIADPNANTDAAERAVVDPRIRQLCKHADAKGWGACAACPAP